MLNRARCFPKSKRLLRPIEFRNVFANGKRYRCRAFTVTVTRNDIDYPRLGLAISKKAAAKAVDRNRIKRLVRESFRRKADVMIAVDIVVQATFVTRTQSNETLLAILDKLWLKLK